MEDRAKTILEAAIVVARKHGIAGLTKPRIALEAQCSPALITHYWGPIGDLHNAVVEAAILREELAVIARAMAESHPIALAAAAPLRERAALSLTRL